MIAAHLPALAVVVPLAAAPLIVLVRHAGAAWALAVAAAWFSFGASLALAAQVADAGVVSYAMGNWPPPWGIEYRVDALSAFVVVLVSAIGAAVAPYALKSVAAEVPGELRYLYYAMHCLCLAGLLGMAMTGDAFNLFVFMEVASLAMYVLIALGRDRRALLASYQYLLLGTIGATFYVIGVGVLYLQTGTLNIADMAARLPAVAGGRPAPAALAFITAGMSLKLALFPLHLWLPNAYAYAPSAATAFLAATATKVSVYVLLRFHFSVFGESAVTALLPMPEILIALSIAAIVTASLVAVWQADFKRLLAYSSVAQIGYITLGIGLATRDGLTAAVVHLFNHGITKGALFLLAGGIVLRAGGARFENLRGLGRSMPLTALGITLAGLSLIGVPGTAGFISKWYLVLGAIEAGMWWLAALVVLTSLIAVVYVWRFVEAAYLSEPGEAAPRPGEAPMPMLVVSWLMVAACLWFGFDTSFTVGGASRAAQLLLGGAP
ncbi:MAG: monovalent cation/H+ antiporter subunit D family protein [Betaproteobacteria bacterium]|nr:monovalent cation/H+ antiporter subunit D family protein [Betaproteobacteria bacterium]MDH5219909.1 monovalent cation/H+ antiporter subunit D family protein [Betaproteobacteria bacterium]MDH5349591.1 monovalent cation/H+ antiporter subunit D family protein [Betaproteobacteria bacterium]